MRDTPAERQRLKEALQTRIKNLKVGNAKVVMRANTHWLGNLLCEAESRELPPIRVDEPLAMGGGNTAANPMELVLSALGTCQEILYSAYAALLDIPLDSVEVSLAGHLDLREMFDLQHEGGAGFTKIRFETRLQSPASEADIRKLIETVERCCPVLDMLERPVPVTGQVHLNDKPLTPYP
ncbi:MAG: OsmC family protein [Chloroflexota bacterium]